MTPSTRSLYPSDICAICGETRENHGDKRHVFSVDGELVDLPTPAKARQQSPEGRALAKDPTANLMLRVVQKLIAKNILDGEDLVYIFGGESNADYRGPAGG